MISASRFACTGFTALLLSASMAHSATLWTVDFEGSSSLPSGWSQNQLSGSGSWSVQTGSGQAPGGGTGSGRPSGAHGGVNNITFYNPSAGTRSELLSPVFNSSTNVNLALSFWHTQWAWSGDQDVLKVHYSDDGGSTWVQLAEYTTSITSWTQRTIPLPAPSATSRIAFEGTANYGFGICLDDVQVTGDAAGTLPDVSVSATDADAGEEGPDTGTWTITRGGDTVPAVTVYYTFSGSATETDDFTSNPASSVSFASGETSKPVTLTPVDDAVYDEPDEIATLTLTPNAAYGIVTASDDITIVDNDTADVKVLIVGSTRDSTDDSVVGNGNSDAFDASAISTQLENILNGAGIGVAGVTFLDRSAEGYSSSVYSLAQWFHYPYPAGVETNTRWPNLRGEGDNAWDYVVVIGDPYTMEYMPGLYAQGVQTIAEEVAKGTNGAETILLMPWPASGSSSTVNHYKEVVYRAGHTGGHKVAPAAIAWQDAGSPATGGHPNADGSFIAAASIYSRIWGQSASASSYNYNDTMANSVYASVTNAMTQSHYSGSTTFQNPFLMPHDKRRDVHFSEKGTSTEQDYKGAAVRAIQTLNAKYDHSSYSDRYNDNTPDDDGAGWPVGNTMPIAWNHGRKFAEPNKEYVLNTNFWTVGLGFRYQANTWSLAVEDANDTQINALFSQGIDLVDYQLTEGDSARTIPWRLLWAQIHQEYPALNPLRDGSGPHVNTDLREAVGTYMYTLFSGRCPLEKEPATMNASYYAEKVGYETAWRVGTGRSRAPGFKVKPTSSTGTNVTPSTTQQLLVEFIFAPTSDVTVAVTSDDAYRGEVSPSVMTFTPANYMNAQTVTVTGVSGPVGDYIFNTVLTTSSSDPAYHGLMDSWDFQNTRPEGPVPSDIRILGNGNTIISGDMTPETALNTDFGVTSSSVIQTFTITNLSSSATVTLTDTPQVSVSGAGGHFALTQDAGTTNLMPGAFTTFQITYTPLSGGSHTALVSVASSDSAVPTYTFGIAGIRPGTPSASTAGANVMGPSSASLSGQLAGGGVAEAWICWGDNDGGTGSPQSWDYSAAIGTVAQGVNFSNQVNSLLYGIQYSYRIYVSNSVSQAWSTVDTFTTDAPDLSGGIPGLISGTVAGNIDTTTANPGNGDGNAITNMGPWRAQAGGWPGNTTYIYTGQMYFDGTDYFFVESIDDRVWLKIDGVVYINDGSWNNVSSSGLISKPEGWYDFELRMSNGSGGSGPVNRTPGFQYHNGGGIDDTEVNNWYPVDPGDATLFRTAYASPVPSIMITNTTATNIAASSASLRGVINSTQSVFTVTAYWSTNNNATAAAWLADTSASSASAGSVSNILNQSISYSVNSLQPGKTYYYTFKASNAATNMWAAPNASFTTSSEVTTNHSVPHSWLSSINASWSNDYEAAVMADQDNDGFTTWEEYWSGTDPDNGNSHLKIDSISFDGTNPVLEWQHSDVGVGIPDIVILASTNVLTGPWVVAGQKVPLNGMNMWTNSSAQQLFFRLAVTNAP